MPHALVGLIDILVSIGALVLTALLFRASLPPRGGGTRWFIGTRWGICGY